MAEVCECPPEGHGSGCGNSRLVRAARELARKRPYDRCRRCLGMGYKGRMDRRRWVIRCCPRCGGNGVDPRPETLPENRRAR